MDTNQAHEEAAGVLWASRGLRDQQGLGCFTHIKEQNVPFTELRLTRRWGGGGSGPAATGGGPARAPVPCGGLYHHGLWRWHFPPSLVKTKTNNPHPQAIGVSLLCFEIINITGCTFKNSQSRHTRRNLEISLVKYFLQLHLSLAHIQVL